VDGGTEETYFTSSSAGTDWQWSVLNGHLTGGERVFYWTPGTHTLVFRCRQNSTFLDSLFVSNDRTLTPMWNIFGLLGLGLPELGVASPEGAPMAPAPADESGSIPMNPSPGTGGSIAGAAVTGLAVASADARTVTLTWQTDKPTWCFVNYGTNEWFDQSTAWTTEMTTQHSVSLSDLTPESTYAVQVVTVDSEGNISWADPGSVVTSPLNIVSWSAEDGYLAGSMGVRSDDTALNGSYVSTEAGGAGIAFYPVEVTVPSMYGLWCLVRVLESGIASFGISVNETDEQIVQVTQPEGLWQWVRIHPQPGNLESGVQRILLRTMEAGMLIDELTLSNDPQWVPWSQTQP
jgi:hypothetical protein